MTPPAQLYRRGMTTVLASWEEYARGAPGAEVRRLPGVAAAIFPNEPERSVYNNAILGRSLAAAERAGAVAAMETAYEARGVTRFAAWVHETDELLRADLERRGYTVHETTRAMGMPLADILGPRPELELGSAGWDEYLRIFGLPARLLGGADLSVFHLLFARLDGESVTAAMAFDHDGDCGIYNVGTLEHARRRGLATALTAVHLHDAAARGCTTASVQSTGKAERVYAAVGFRDLGLILEYVPQTPRHSRPDMRASFPIRMSDTAAADDRRELEDRLDAFNVESTGYRDARDLSCFVRDAEGTLVAGIDGFTWGGYAHVAVLWVSEPFRGQGLGRRLLEAAEAEARERGCTSIVLSSHEFQAPGFYEKVGYHPVGATEDTPVGFRELHFQKRLVAGEER